MQIDIHRSRTNDGYVILVIDGEPFILVASEAARLATCLGEVARGEASRRHFISGEPIEPMEDGA